MERNTLKDLITTARMDTHIYPSGKFLLRLKNQTAILRRIRQFSNCLYYSRKKSKQLKTYLVDRGVAQWYTPLA